jgi:hypothetical protein
VVFSLGSFSEVQRPQAFFLRIEQDDFHNRAVFGVSNPLTLPVAGGLVCLWGWFCRKLLPNGGLARLILPALFAACAQLGLRVAELLQFEP